MVEAIALASAALDENGEVLSLNEFCLACRVEPDFVQVLIQEGVITARPHPAGPRFGSIEIVRVRRLRRLQRDFEASVPAAGLMLDLLDEIDRLRTALQCAGVAEKY
ncbi:MAG: chaperone modulator CbpM [Burkholderiaceae bacterium]